MLNVHALLADGDGGVWTRMDACRDRAEKRVQVGDCKPSWGKPEGKKKVSWPCLRRETHYFPVSKVFLLSHLGTRDLASNLTHHLEKSVNEWRQEPPKKNSGLNRYFP